MSDYRMQEADESPEQTAASPNARWWAIAGIVCGVLALVVPIIFGPAGIALGIVARVKGAGTISTVAIVLSAVLLVVGLVGGAVLTSVLAPSAAGGAYAIWGTTETRSAPATFENTDSH